MKETYFIVATKDGGMRFSKATFTKKSKLACVFPCPFLKLIHAQEYNKILEDIEKKLKTSRWARLTTLRQPPKNCTCDMCREWKLFWEGLKK